MPSASPSPATPLSDNGDILLIEEYDALAIALESALAKFAPNRGIRRVRSIAQAAEALRAALPALLIVDFDPAGPGLTSLLCQLRDQSPDSRVLVMGPGVDHQLAADFRSLGAIELVEKPFDIVDLGAAVQALLGPWKSKETDGLRSSIKLLSVADVVLAQCAGGRTSRIEVKSGKRRAEVVVREGEIIGAVAGKLKNADALDEIFSWAEVELHESDVPSGARRGIRRDWRVVLIEAVRRAHSSRPQPRPAVVEPAVATPTVPPAPVAAPPAPKTGKKIVVIDDTEMLLIFVEDVLSTADPQLQITAVPTGVSGVKQVESIRPDLVLLDFSLPDINGDEVCRRLLASETTSQIPVLMMSGHVPEMTAAAVEFDNIVGTIAKPFMSDALVALVQQTLRAGLRPVPKKKAAPIVTATRPSPPKPATIAKAAPPPRPPTKVSPPVAPPVKQPQPPATPVLKSPPTPKPPPPPAAVSPPPPAPSFAPPEHKPAEPARVSAPVIGATAEEVVIGMYLEVLSMQLTPTLRMGNIRARLSSGLVSLHMSRSAAPAETAFHLAQAKLNPDGTLAAVRLEPTQQPFQPLPTQNALQIGALSVVPADSRTAVQLTPSGAAPMMMHLLARLTLGGVELSTGFQLARLVLHSRSNTVRVTLSSDLTGAAQTGVFCEMTGIHLDSASQLVEVLLKPLK